MTTPDFTNHFTVDPHDLRRLHARLEREAQVDGLLDIAYRTVDSAVGPLLLAATPQGLLRVAFASEGHELVLEDLAQRISHDLRAMAQNQRAPRKDVVDVLVAIDVVNLRSFSARDKRRRASDAAEGSHR